MILVSVVCRPAGHKIYTLKLNTLGSLPLGRLFHKVLQLLIQYVGGASNHLSWLRCLKQPSTIHPGTTAFLMSYSLGHNQLESVVFIAATF